MTWETFIAAVESMDAFFAYPWTYNFTAFTEDETGTDVTAVWSRIADNMIGYDYTSVAQGSMALLRIVETLESRDLTDTDKERVALIREMGVYTRADNSAFIKANFPDDLLQQVADKLQEESDTYAAMNIDDQAGLIAGFKKCAELEAEIGALINTYCASLGNN